MPNNYCGKSCDQCPKYLGASCVGCKDGSYSKDCRIAKCCIDRGHDFCGICIHAPSCTTRNQREQMPERMIEEMQRTAAVRSRRLSNAEKFGTWLLPIFWLMIAQIVVSLLDTELITSSIPVMGTIVPLVMGVIAAAVGICYLLLRDVDQRYQTVGIIQLVVAGYDLIGDRFLEGKAIGLLAMLAVLVMTIYSKYCQYMAHADALHGIDDELESKWLSQWNWNKIVFISLPVTLLVMLIPLINMLAMIALIALCGLLVFLTVRDYMYLYHMANLFRDYSDEW